MKTWQIAALDTEQLRAYFRENAQYIPEATTHRYVIQFGNLSLRNFDKSGLRDQFFRAVREAKRKSSCTAKKYLQ